MTLLVALLVAGGLVACEPPPPPAPAVVAGSATASTRVAERDTFVASHRPDAERGGDVVMRVMGSPDKTKVAYMAFPVAAGGPVDATLSVAPRQDGFALDVRTAGPFTEATTFADRPALGAVVGRLDRTRAGAVQALVLQGVPVVEGHVWLALTTSGPYELEIVSTEGAAAAKASATAPRLAITPAPSTTTPPTPPPPTTRPSGPQGWDLSWSDEFDGTRVDPAKWNVYDEGGTYTSVESPKGTTCPKASNVSVRDGILVMRTRKANGSCRGGQAQSGAGMNTWGKFAQAQGRFEARVRWTTTGNNLWGGFWTHANGGAGYDRSMGSELDIFEYIGKTSEPNISRYKPAIHFNYTCNPKCMQNVPVHGHDVTDWHTYAVEWGPTVPGDPASTQIRFSLDGRPVAQFDRFGAWAVNPNGTKVLVQQGGWTNDNGPFPTPFGPDRAHRIILSAWVGAPLTDAATVARGYDPPDGVADLQVDWVRVYRRR